MEHKREVTVFALIVFLTFGIYSPSLTSPFIFDDFSTIVDNPFIKHLDLSALWGYDPSRFVTNVTFAVNYLFFGLNPGSWHLMNLALHAASAFLLFRLSCLFFELPKIKGALKPEQRPVFAFLVSMVFLVHPLQTQAVIYTVQRSTLLCTFLIISSLYYYLRWRLMPASRYWALSAALAYAGMMTKPLFMVFPLLVFLVEIYGFGMDKKVDIRRAIMYFFLCLPLLIIPVLLLGLEKLNALIYTGCQSMPWKERLLTQLNVVMTYLRLLVVPWGQNLDYEYPVAHSFFAFPTFLSGAAVVALIVLAVRSYKYERWISWGIFWSLIALVPVTIFPLNDVIFEHWLYLPMIGFAMIISRILLIAVSGGRGPGRMIVVVIVLCALSVLSYQRARLWADPVVLLKDTIAKSPGNERAYNNLGLVFFKQKRFNEAAEFFQKAVFLNPHYFVAQNNLSLVYLEEGRLMESERILKELIQKYPGYVDAYLNLAQLYERTKQDDKALEFAYRGLEQDPYQPSAYLTLGNILQNKNKLVQAREAYQKVIWLKPETASVFYNLGNVYFKEGNYFEALQYYEKAWKMHPDMLEAYVNAGNVYYYFGDFPAAIEQYSKAVAKGTVLPEAYFNLANALHATGDVEGSKKYVQQAVLLYEKQGRGQDADRIRKILQEMDP